MCYSTKKRVVEKDSCEMLHQTTNTTSICLCHHCAVSLSREGLCLSHNGAQTITKLGTTFLRIQQRPKYLAIGQLISKCLFGILNSSKKTNLL